MINYPSINKFAKAAAELKKFKAVVPFKPNYVKAPSITGHVRTVGTGAARLGGVVGAAAYGAYRIRKASKAANKEIESIHSPARNVAHNKMLAAIKASGQRRRAKATAAKKLRSTLKSVGVNILSNPLNYIPGGQGSKGFDYRKWR